MLIDLLLWVGIVKPTLKISGKGDIVVEIDRLCGSVNAGTRQLRLFFMRGGAIEIVVVIVVGGIVAG